MLYITETATSTTPVITTAIQTDLPTINNLMINLFDNSKFVTPISLSVTHVYYIIIILIIIYIIFSFVNLSIINIYLFYHNMIYKNYNYIHNIKYKI